MPPVTRRAWLERALLFGAAVAWADATGAQGLDRFIVPAAPCDTKPTLTPAADVGADFKPGAPARRTLAERETAGPPLSLSGTVSGLTCGRIAGARVDLWQADARGTIDAAGFRLRGHQVTDGDGRYAFETVVPGAPPARAPRLNLRVEVPRDRLRKPGQNRTFMTALFLPAQPRNAADPLFRPELVLKPAPAAGAASYVFDVILDL